MVLTADELRAKLKIYKSVLLSYTVKQCQMNADYEVSDFCFLLIIDKNHLEESSSESQVFTL